MINASDIPNNNYFNLNFNVKREARSIYLLSFDLLNNSDMTANVVNNIIRGAFPGVNVTDTDQVVWQCGSRLDLLRAEHSSFEDSFFQA